MKILQRMSLVTGVALLAALMALPLAAQQQYAGIKGTIIGLNNKPLPNAQVIFTRTDAKGTVNAKTDKKGKFEDDRVPAGTYSMSVVASTGQTVPIQQGIKAEAGKMLNAHVNLAVIAAAENGGPPPKGMSADEAAAYAKRKKETEAKDAKMGKLNTLLAQNKQLYEAKNYTQAIAIMQQAVAIDQKHDILYANLAEDYVAAKQYKNAADAYQKAIALKPTDAGYEINLGSALAEGGDTAGANAAFSKAAQMDPTQAKLAIYNEGVVLYNKNDITGAEAAFSKTIALDPNNANAWYYKAMCLVNQSKTDPKTSKMIPAPGTKQALEKVISLAPNSTQAQTAKAILQSIGS
ncbi:MAG: carboxypeptidase regulatory-like domain-containing protein [Terriglobales bacterium]